MTKEKTSIRVLVPVFLTFYVMGFVDLVGVATGYVKQDFGLSDSRAQLLPMMVFLWFALVSIPTGIFQDRRGKKFTVNLGILITALGMLVPFIHYTYLTAVLGFMILGIGNTILQVSANPLLLDISAKGTRAANLSLSQFIKATASMLGPIITVALARLTGNWKLVFPLYAALSVLSALWLYSVKVEESRPEKKPATFGSVLSLLRLRFVFIMIIGTFLMVGFDVGINSNIATFLSTKFAISLDSASIGISIYFASLMVGRFLGAIFLRKLNPINFFIISSLITLGGLAGILLSGNLMLTRILIFVTGLGFSNTFPIIFALTIDRMPDYSNELSGLIILSVSGGAILPPLMGILTDLINVNAIIYVLIFCMIYVTFAAFYAASVRKPIDLSKNQ
jgi:FHS family L-fucose permease-like MFS transporter